LAFLPEDPAPMVATFAPCPTVAIIGGADFVARSVIKALVANGQDVRLIGRRGAGFCQDMADHVECMAVDLTDNAALAAAMTGMQTVFNLSGTGAAAWDMQTDQAVLVAEAAIASGVARFIHASSILPYDASDPLAELSETSPFGEMTGRSPLAQTLSDTETQLLGMHRDKGLPLVICRPGIVLGQGGPLQNLWIGRWNGPGAVRMWGNGRNILPFVLVDDLADGLLRMAQMTGISGQSFNLIGDPLLSAHDFLDGMQKRTAAQTKTRASSHHATWLAETAVSGFERYVLQRPMARQPSLADVTSRAFLARFRNDHAKSTLGWQPEIDREVFLDRAITTTSLFGF
jgi:nucleoside-diphosphate-sugar epimerase